jgi:hypothetical protein
MCLRYSGFANAGWQFEERKEHGIPVLIAKDIDFVNTRGLNGFKDMRE